VRAEEHEAQEQSQSRALSMQGVPNALSRKTVRGCPGAISDG
jgi:hypothetical protein